MERGAVKALLVETKANAVGEEVFYFQASVGTKDREGEIVTVDGWDFGNFLKNPVFMGLHDYESWPLGKIVELEPNDQGFKIGVVFDDLDPEALKVKSKYQRGFLNAVSAGFIRKETTGKRIGKDWITTKKELLEVSAVPIPQHPDALRTSKQFEMEETVAVGIKAVDFNAAMALRTMKSNLWERKYAIESALDTAADSILGDEALTHEQKVANIAEACTQAGAALAAWYADKLAVNEACAAMGVKNANPDLGQKAGRSISAKNADTIDTCVTDMESAMKSMETCCAALKSLTEAKPEDGEKANQPPCADCGKPCCEECKGIACEGGCCDACKAKKSLNSAVNVDMAAFEAFVNEGKE